LEGKTAEIEVFAGLEEEGEISGAYGEKGTGWKPRRQYLNSLNGKLYKYAEVELSDGSVKTPRWDVSLVRRRILERLREERARAQLKAGKDGSTQEKAIESRSQKDEYDILAILFGREKIDWVETSACAFSEKGVNYFQHNIATLADSRERTVFFHRPPGFVASPFVPEAARKGSAQSYSDAIPVASFPDEYAALSGLFGGLGQQGTDWKAVEWRFVLREGAQGVEAFDIVKVRTKSGGEKEAYFNVSEARD
jgi:hypothetical protein